MVLNETLIWEILIFNDNLLFLIANKQSSEVRKTIKCNI
jgi:hypothetical protein